jgi:DNA-directed RNA polymerase sigma subunit (sigma70/sigma32)
MKKRRERPAGLLLDVPDSRPSPVLGAARAILSKAVARLPQAQGVVIRARYGIGADGRWGAPTRTFASLGREYGVSAQNIAYMEEAAIKRLRRMSIMRRLRPLLSCY